MLGCCHGVEIFYSSLATEILDSWKARGVPTSCMRSHYGIKRSIERLHQAQIRQSNSHLSVARDVTPQQAHIEKLGAYFEMV